MKTLNLEQMGVQEMDAVEVKEVDGGFFGLFVYWFLKESPEGYINYHQI